MSISDQNATGPSAVAAVAAPTATVDRKGKGKAKAVHHLSAGALSGFTSAICLQPLDLLKTRLQQAGGTSDAAATGSGSSSPIKRRRLGATVRQVVRDDGVLGLWRGTFPTLVRNVPGVAIYFYALSAIRTELSLVPYFQVRETASSSSDPSSSRSALVKLSSQGNLVAGAIARTSVGFVLNPITVLKARYESNRYNEYRSLYGSFKDLVKTSGARGLFQGFTATAVRDAPYAGLYLVCYEKGKDLASRVMRPDGPIPHSLLYSACGAGAAMTATFATSPADCVKTRMQVNPKDHPTLRKAIMRIYADRGVAGFFSGSSLRISRKAASSAIAWTVYEALLIFLRDQAPGSVSSA